MSSNKYFRFKCIWKKDIVAEEKYFIFVGCVGPFIWLKWLCSHLYFSVPVDIVAYEENVKICELTTGPKKKKVEEKRKQKIKQTDQNVVRALWMSRRRASSNNKTDKIILAIKSEHTNIHKEMYSQTSKIK